MTKERTSMKSWPCVGDFASYTYDRVIECSTLHKEATLRVSARRCPNV